MAISDSYSAAWIPQARTKLEDRYEVISNLDKGGMGVVLRALDTETNTEVAIKMVSPKLARTGKYRERFAREVELATEIKHPHVIRCHSFGETEDGALFLVMELLDGLPLTHHVRNQARLSTTEALNIGIQALEGLAAAHRLDIIHRDLKPGNIYLVERGDELDVKLLDFGLAKSLSSEEVRLTRTGAICGTASYVAPESLMVEEPGKPGDVYAMGLVLLEMLFGRKVYPSKQMAQTFMEQLVVPARIPRRVWDEPIGRVIRRALQKHPAERYADAEQMLDAMRAVVDQTGDFVLGNEEIPPASSDLPKELLDDLADGRYRTVDTLHNMPVPEPWDPGSQEFIDDRALLDTVLADISKSDMDAAFDTILREELSSASDVSEVSEGEEVTATAAPYHGLGSPPPSCDEADASVKTAVVYGLLAVAAFLASIALSTWYVNS